MGTIFIRSILLVSNWLILSLYHISYVFIGFKGAGCKKDLENRKWLDTEMKGILKIVIVQEKFNVPMAMLQLYNDAAGAEGEMIFEYELPCNFKTDPKVHESMTALGIMQGHFIGFLFTKPMEKQAFDHMLKSL